MVFWNNYWCSHRQERQTFDLPWHVDSIKDVASLISFHYATLADDLCLASYSNLHFCSFFGAFCKASWNIYFNVLKKYYTRIYIAFWQPKLFS